MSTSITSWYGSTYHIHPQSIKRQLTETAHSAHSANSALGRFVGIEAYEASGGVLLRDLFDDRASAHMENPELLERLAIEKLQAVAKPFEATWKWVEVHLSVDYGAFRSFGRVYPQHVDPDPDLLAEEERLIAREEELAAQNDGEDWTDANTTASSRGSARSRPCSANGSRTLTKIAPSPAWF